jgi:predicted flap endonuclease-1-like 5' DNA nuclease
MGNKIELIATVKSPARESSIRKGEGYSLKEIEESGKSLNQLKALNIKVDYYRKSSHSENVEKLKNLKLPEKKKKKRKPFVKKEKKRTAFTPKIEKPKVKPKKAVKEAPKIPVEKKKVEKVKKEKVKPAKKEKVKAEVKGRLLTELSGLGAATAKKFVELGVETVEELIKENPEELTPLIKGVSLERLTKWIEEGKELIKQ